MKPVGAGSYRTDKPAAIKNPPQTIYRTERLTGPTPTSDWCSSLAWTKFSERQYPHPLAVRCAEDGLRVYYPGPGIRADRAAIFGFMPGDRGDLTLGHSAEKAFPDARLDGFGDWTVTASFAKDGQQMRVTYGHGLPFVYARYVGGGAAVSFAKKPKVWAGDANSAALGITIDGRHYGLFGPTGSTWSGLDGTRWVNHAGGKDYFSLAVLPDARPATFEQFRRCAHAHVVDTRVRWEYRPQSNEVHTHLELLTEPLEGTQRQTLFALYPHQWRHLAKDSVKLVDAQYESVRGAMKLAQGTKIETVVKFPGVLPAMPVVDSLHKGESRQTIVADIRRQIDEKPPGRPLDTYWGGKRLGRLAALVPIAEQLGEEKLAAGLTERMRGELEQWLAAAPQNGQPDRQGFYYNATWGTLIGYPASFGSDAELNDHHFHYGYLIRAAAEVARRDGAWAKETAWAPMIDLLIRDVASPDRQDKLFPFLRNFDPYAGHSWASGHARFGDGNNNESSSEAMNAWTGLILWGQATGNTQIRDLGIWLYATEMTAIHEYWFDVRDANHPADYTPSVVTMVWGGKGANGTWFSANPEAVHGINFLPVGGGSLYLGHWPEYVAKNYAAMASENGSTHWDQWADILWMYRALSDPADARSQFNARPGNFRCEAGNSLANTLVWIAALEQYGRVDPTVTADWPLYAVLQKGKARTYVAFNTTSRRQTVAFSDGTRLDVPPKQFGIRSTVE